MLNRLMQKIKSDDGVNLADLNLHKMSNDSNIRRNHLVLEDVLRQRCGKQWEMDTATKMHQVYLSSSQSMR